MLMGDTKILEQVEMVIGGITRNCTVKINGKKYVDAVVISISMPDDMSFESMKRLAEYFLKI